MYVVVELWKARPAWFERSAAERAAYLETVVPHIRELVADGTELVTIGSADRRNNGEEPDYDYWAVWRFQDQDHLLNFTHAIETAGWHTFFERVNAGVEARAVEDILAIGRPSDGRTNGVAPVRAIPAVPTHGQR